MTSTLSLQYRPATAADIGQCIILRGLTRENAVSATRLAELGITEASWGGQVAAGDLPGHICMAGSQMAGYCFGDSGSGEVVVLALLPAFEGQGIGQALLRQVMALLRERGHQRLFLACSADPQVRSYGFYRHLGWRGTGEVDDHGDEELEWQADA